MPQEIIDVHVHCFTGRGDWQLVRSQLASLQQAGLRRVAVVGLVNTRLDAEAVWNLLPRFDNLGDPLFHEAEDLLALTALSDEALVPLVDTRHLWGKVPDALQGYLDRGFRGIKGIYLQDNENDVGVGNVPDSFGITLQQYQRREWEIFDFAHSRDLPLLYHMDARRFGDLMQALLDDFPGVRVNFPHFGISRKAFCKVLDRYPNVFTDLSSMLPHMRGNPESYRDFIMHYPDRVCFGSDAMLYSLGTVADYIQMVRDLNLPREVEDQVFSLNPTRFLGSALERTVMESAA